MWPLDELEETARFVMVRLYRKVEAIAVPKRQCGGARISADGRLSYPRCVVETLQWPKNAPSSNRS